MKKNLRFIIPALLFCLSFSVSQAQISLGVRGGVNFATFAVTDSQEDFPFKPKIGLNAALLINVPLSSVMSIQFEPGFSQRGARISTETGGVINNQQVKIEIEGKLLTNNIELPVLLQFKPKFGKLMGIVSLGPELRYMVGNIKSKASSKVFVDGQLIDESNDDETFDSGDDSRKLDFGAVGGLGLAYPIGPLQVFAEGRYHLGLRNLATPVDGDNSKIFNRGASAHLGILIPLGQ